VRYTYYTSRLATGITVDGNIAYIAGGYIGMLIWDISNPGQPVQLGIFNPGRAVFDIDIQGDIACLANEFKGIMLVDVSNPQSPQIIETCDTPDVARYIVYRENRVYVAAYQGFCIVDVSDPLPTPSIIGSYYVQNDEYSSLAIQNNDLYVVNSWDGLKILDVSIPYFPELQADYSAMDAKCVQVINDKAYLLSAFGSYDIIDVSNPDNPQALGSYSDLSYPVTATVVGNSAFILDQDEGLMILNITDASNPTLQGTYSDINLPYALAIRGNYAYIINRSPAFPTVRIVNVSNHASPQYAGEQYMPYEPNSIAIYGSYAYIVSGSEGLQVYQIVNSTTLTLLSSFMPRPTSNLVLCYVNGARLYVSDDNWNVIDVFDLSNPSQPSLVNSYKSNYVTADMKVSNNLLYAANEYSGMHIFDLSIVGNTQSLSETPLLSLSNYPNPFNPSTTISFEVPVRSEVKLSIYNIKGQLVRCLAKDIFSPGKHSVVWDGTDSKGISVGSGVYCYRFHNGKDVITKRMTLLK
jgi:hypothetical protein